MAYKIEGETCPVCKAYLFEEDDIVFCPVCGAPHHRDCYAAVGHCGLADKHGTAQQYSPKSREEEEPKAKDKTDLCPNCGKDKVDNALFCPFCGYDYVGGQKPNFGSQPYTNGFTPFPDPYGGIPRDGSVTVDGESVEDVKKFVFTNTQRYIPLFCRQNKKHKSNWNWAAFILPHCWLFFRKHYVAGAIALALMLVAEICQIPMNADLRVLMESGSQVVTTEAEQMRLILSLIPQIPISSIITSAVGVALAIGTSVYFGLMGDWHYRSHTVSSIKAIKADTTLLEKDEAFLKKGATSIWGFTLAYMAWNLIPQIVALFI